MNSLIDKVNIFFESVPDKARNHRYFIWILFILLSVIIVSGANKVKMDTSLEAFFSENDPIKRAYEKFRSQFGSDEIVYLVYEPKDKDIFSSQSLHVLKEFQDELLTSRYKPSSVNENYLNRITEVKTIINATYIEATSDDLISRQFIGDKIPHSKKELLSLKKNATEHPDYPLLYLSKDAHFGGIMIRTNLSATIEQDIVIEKDGFIENDIAMAETSDATKGSTNIKRENKQTTLNTQIPKFKNADFDDYVGLMNALQNIIEKPEYSEHFTFHPVGNPPIFSYQKDVIIKELGMISFLCLILILSVLGFLFRSIAGMLWPTIIVSVSLLWIFGLIGWMGITITLIINVTVFMVLAVGIANAIHILSGYLFFRQLGQEHQTAIRSVFKKSGLACFLTSLTTAVGLIALAAIPIVPIKVFGVFSAIGVLLVFIFSIFLLPLMLDILSPYSSKKENIHKNRKNIFQIFLRKYEHLSYHYPYTIVGIFFVFMVLSLFGSTMIIVDSNPVEVFPKESTIRQDVSLVDKHMGGAQNATILITTNSEDALKDPRLLTQIEALQDYALITYPDKVILADSIVNVTKLIYKALNEGQSAMYKIPQDRDLLEQTLFIFNNTNAKDRRLLVSDDYSSGKITLTLKNAGSNTYTTIMNDIQGEANELFKPLKKNYPDLNVSITGSMSLVLQYFNYISWSQIKSFGLTLVVITLILLVVFGSIKIGIIAIIPNLFPIFTAFGIMGFLGLPLDGDTLIIAPIIISIAVDDTIHFLTHYRAGIYQHGSITTAIQQSIREAGQAVSFTSITLIAGFSAFMLSSHGSTQNFGLTSAIAIGAALLADLLLLPALCVICKADFSQAIKTTSTQSAIAAQ